MAHIEYLDRNYDKALFYINMYESLIPEGYIGSPSLKMSIISEGYSPSEANKYAISIEPKIQNFSIEEKANFYYDWGGVLASEEKYVEAIEKYQETIKVNPKHPYAYSEICQRYSELKDGKNAIKYCEIGIKVFPHPLVYDHACYAYYIDKQYESALKYCNFLIDNKYDIPNTYYHRALIYKELNKKEEAKNDLKKAKDLVNNWGEEKSLTEANYTLEKGDKELIKKIDDLLNKL